MSPEATTIALDDRRRHIGVWWQQLQHAIGGVPLLLAGVQRVSTPGGIGDPFAYAEIIVAAVLLGMLARDLSVTEQHAHAHAGPEWFDVVAGIMLIVEAVHASSLGGKPFYARPNFLLGVVTVAVGLLHGRLSRRAHMQRELRLDESGVHARLSRFRKFSVPWSDIRAIHVSESAAIIETGSDTHSINLRLYRNASAIRVALDTWSRARLPPATT